MEKEEDEDTQEITYTAEVGKIPDDGAAAGGGGKMLLMAAHPQLAQDVRAAFAGGLYFPWGIAAPAGFPTIMLLMAAHPQLAQDVRLRGWASYFLGLSAPTGSPPSCSSWPPARSCHGHAHFGDWAMHTLQIPTCKLRLLRSKFLVRQQPCKEWAGC